MTENEILELKLKPRGLSEKRLVEIFATPSIYERYKNNGRFIGSDKKRVLERASKFCKIRDDESHCAGVCVGYCTTTCGGKCFQTCIGGEMPTSIYQGEG